MKSGESEPSISSMILLRISFLTVSSIELKKASFE